MGGAVKAVREMKLSETSDVELIDMLVSTESKSYAGKVLRKEVLRRLEKKSSASTRRSVREFLIATERVADAAHRMKQLKNKIDKL